MIEVDLLSYLCLAAAFSLIFVGIILIVAYAKQPPHQDAHHQESPDRAEASNELLSSRESPGFAEARGEYHGPGAKSIVTSTSRSVNNFYLGGGILSSVLGSLIVGYVVAPSPPPGPIERDDVAWIIEDDPRQTKGDRGDGNQQAPNREQDRTDYFKKLFENLIYQGIQYELEGLPDLAYEKYKKALTQRNAPLWKAAQAMSRMAQIRLDQGHVDEAIQLAYIAVGLDSNSSLYRNTLARILIIKCQLDEADRELDQISNNNPTIDDLRQVLAEKRRSTCAIG